MIFLSGRFGSLLTLIIMFLLVDGIVFNSKYLITPAGKFIQGQISSYQAKQDEVKKLQDENAALKINCRQ